MSKAAISSIVAIILGYLGSAFGAEIMNWPQLGPILAIVVMGSAIITSLEKKNNCLINFSLPNRLSTFRNQRIRTTPLS